MVIVHFEFFQSVSVLRAVTQKLDRHIEFFQW